MADVQQEDKIDFCNIIVQRSKKNISTSPSTVKIFFWKFSSIPLSPS